MMEFHSQGERENSSSSETPKTWLKRAYESSDGLLRAASNMMSCDATVSLWSAWASTPLGLSKKASNSERVDVRGRRIAEIVLTRRPLFLSGQSSIGFSVPCLDDEALNKGSITSRQANSGLSESPFSGTWRGKFFDGMTWKTADIVLFWQDLIGRATGSRIQSSLDLMGSCTPRDTSPSTTGGTSGLAIVGSFDPTTGRVAWSQASPQHEGITWEVWGQLYSSSSLEEEGRVADRILASWQDTEGRRGNLELLLREEDAFAVADSFWSSAGLDLYVYELPAPDSKAVTLPKGWSLPPGVPAPTSPARPSANLHNKILSPEPSEHRVLVPRPAAPGGSSHSLLPHWRTVIPPVPSEAVLEDPSGTLV